MTRYAVLVEVSLRPGIADPQGATIERALPALGFQHVSAVRAGKAFRFVLDAADEESARTEVDQLRAVAEAEIQRERQAAAAAASDRAARLAVEIAEKLLNRLPDSARIDGFVGGLADGLSIATTLPNVTPRAPSPGMPRVRTAKSS